MTRSTLALVPLLGSLVALLTAVAALPALLAAGREPAAPPRPLAAPALTLVLARTASGLWYANGTPLRAEQLAQRLRQQGSQLRILMLPSPWLSAAQVSEQLAWLRRHSRGPVQLELMQPG